MTAPDHQWLDPIPIASSSCDVSYPVQVLPAPFADMARDVSTFVQMPQDLAVPFLWGMPAACIGNRAIIEITESHTERPALWSCGIAGTGDRKSAMLAQLAAPLHAWEASEAERLAPRINEIRAMRAITEEELKALRQQVKKAKDPAARKELQEEMAEVIQRSQAPFPSGRLMIQDVTPEAMVTFLSRHDGNAFLCSDEGAVFFDTCKGRYSKDSSANIDAFLNAYSGSPIRIDRTTREGESINNPCLTVAILVQPNVLESMDESGRFRGRGLLARFNYTYPKSLVGRRRYRKEPIPESVLSRYGDAIHHLLMAAREFKAAKPHRVVFTPAALALFAELHDSLEGRIGPGGELEHMADWGSRHPGQIARIAFGIAATESALIDGRLPNHITDEDLARAAELSPAMIEHAQVALGHTGMNPKDRVAARLLAWLERTRPTSFKVHEVKSCWKAESKESIEAAAETLVERNYLVKTVSHRTGPGRPSAPSFLVHPAIHSPECPDNSENSANSRKPSPEAPNPEPAA